MADLLSAEDIEIACHRIGPRIQEVHLVVIHRSNYIDTKLFGGDNA